MLAALDKRPADFNDFLRLMEASGYEVKRGRGGAISFLVPGQEQATRLWASTLGEGFDPEDIRAVIAGDRPAPTSAGEGRPRVNLVIDIQQRMAQGKGPGYERWAKVYNIKQMAAALMYLRENGLADYDTLAAKTEAAVDRAHDLSEKLRKVEAQLDTASELMGAVVDYAKTRPVFDGYKAAKYSKKYLAQHEQELANYRAARATMNGILNGAKLPRMADLKEERAKLAAEKKALYADYRQAQQDMRELVTIKGNIDQLYAVTAQRNDKEQVR